jgi:hypothetical protein
VTTVPPKFLRRHVTGNLAHGSGRDPPDQDGGGDPAAYAAAAAAYAQLRTG